jgi:hypothetical protein
MSRFARLRTLGIKFQAAGVSTVLLLGVGLWLWSEAEGKEVRPLQILRCTGKAVVPGNACGKTQSCTDTSCTDYFVASNGLVTCGPGLPTSNCVAGTGDENLVVCGFGGNCWLNVNGNCQSLTGSNKYTPLVTDGGECFVPTP